MVYRGDDQAVRCGLCGAQLEQGQAQRYAAEDLCEPCFGGQPGQRLEARGIRLQQLTFVTRTRGEHKTRCDFKTIRGVARGAQQLEASFSREGLGSKIGKLFRPELQVGDPLFDDDVYIRTDDPDALGRLLRSPGLQSVLHNAISELADHELPLRLHGGGIELRTQWAARSTGEDALRRIAMIALHYLALDAEASGGAATVAPDEADVTPLFDLEQRLKRRPSGTDLVAVRYWGDRLGDLQGLGQLGDRHNRLWRVGLSDLRLGAPDLSPLGQIGSLEGLALQRLPDLQDLSSLPALPRLKELDLTGCPLTDLTPLARLEALQELTIYRTRVEDLRPLARLGQLKRLHLRQGSISPAELKALTVVAPGMQILTLP